MTFRNKAKQIKTKSLIPRMYDHLYNTGKIQKKINRYKIFFPRPQALFHIMKCPIVPKAVKIIFLAHSFDHILSFLKPPGLPVTFCIKFKLFSLLQASICPCLQCLSQFPFPYCPFASAHLIHRTFHTEMPLIGRRRHEKSESTELEQIM